jgi:hypothetical protein
MKAMKKALVNTCCILGILSLGLLAGCADIINGPSSVSPDAAAGKGWAVVSIGPRLEGARTFMPTEPGSGYYAGLSYAYTFTAVGRNPVSGSITGGTESVELEAGTWDLTVTGMDDYDTGVLEGRVMGIVITARDTTDIQVALAAFTKIGAVPGTLTYSVTIPDDVIKGTLTVYGWDDETIVEKADDLNTGTVNGSTISAADNFSLAAGYYRIALDLYKADGVFHSADIAQIYPGLTTAADYTVAAGDFTGATVGNEASLAAVLAGISGLSSGDNKVYLLSDGIETMSATSVSNGNGPVTVTVDGGGRTVTLSNTGSLVSVGSNVTLVLTNITLQGRGNGSDDPENNTALVYVLSGGTLELEIGARITANKHFTYSSFYGGGVSVGEGGTFTMNGGEILGNTASYGGGVYVSEGTFTLSGGEISGNTASSGGGVYILEGTFTMNGGEISGNTASLTTIISNSYGGGVYVSGDSTFTMSGGEISGNTVSSSATATTTIISYSYGGGVYIFGDSTFIMSGGEISGNTVSSSAYSSASPSTSTSLTASSYSSGGGVYVRGTFTMSGGEISGNTVSSSASSSAYYSSYSSSTGGGVSVSGGTFIMSSGEISDNTVSPSAYYYFFSGGGVYVSDDSTFTLSGGARVNVNNTVYLDYSSASSYSSVTIGGDFTGSADPVAKIDLGVVSDWSGKAVLKLASGYSGNLSALKNRFVLTPIWDYGADYAIGDDGTLQPLSPLTTGITGISYSNVSGTWTLLGDGIRRSPPTNHGGVTKSRVTFTATQANASIAIRLEVSSESGSDYAFISTLDNADAASSGGYYTGSRISGTDWVTITIPIPTAGSHFVDIGYQKDSSQTSGSDCAWYKVVLE